MDDENTYELIGRATVAWSDVELTWYLIYLTLSSAPRDQADAIYFIPNNSATERKVTYSLAEVVLAANPTLLSELGNLLCRTNSAIRDRNAIAHGKFIFARDKDNKSVDLWSVGKNKLIGKPMGSELTRMETDFLSLADDLSTFMFRACIALGREPPSIEK